MIQYFKNLSEEKPLQLILVLSLFLNLIAAFFAHGYYAYDDYFKLVEISWDWTLGKDTDNWFVDDYKENDSLRSVIYPGIVAAMLYLAKFFTLKPFYQMIIVQLLHAIYALFIPYFTYKITLLLSNKKIALVGGLLCATMWLFPFLSVRTLLEWVCVPPVLYALYLHYKNLDQNNWNVGLLIGLMLGVAFCFRFQTAFLVFGYSLSLLIERRWLLFFQSSLSFLLFTVIVQGLGDYLVCNMPFGKLIEYVNYNLEHSGDYVTRPVFDYLILVPALLLPPIGLLLFFGMFYNIKKHLALFLPIVIFFIVHSVFENKQERFIFPILPLVLLIGNLGLHTILNKNFWIQRPKLVKGIWVFHILASLYLLPIMTVNYTKKSKVELMNYLYDKKYNDVLVVENSDSDGCVPMPLFYSGDRLPVIELHSNWSENDQSLAKRNYELCFVAFEVKPEENLNPVRIDKMTQKIGRLKYIKRIEGSLVDNFRFKLNKIVKNYEYELYQVEKLN